MINLNNLYDCLDRNNKKFILIGMISVLLILVTANFFTTLKVASDFVVTICTIGLILTIAMVIYSSAQLLLDIKFN